MSIEYWPTPGHCPAENVFTGKIDWSVCACSARCTLAGHSHYVKQTFTDMSARIKVAVLIGEWKKKKFRKKNTTINDVRYVRAMREVKRRTRKYLLIICRKNYVQSIYLIIIDLYVLFPNTINRTVNMHLITTPHLTIVLPATNKSIFKTKFSTVRLGSMAWIALPFNWLIESRYSFNLQIQILNL